MSIRDAPLTQEGPVGMKSVVTLLNPLVVGEERYEENKRRQIFPKKSYFEMDNHFSGGHVDTLLGKKGYKSITIYRRDCLPK